MKRAMLLTVSLALVAFAACKQHDEQAGRTEFTAARAELSRAYAMDAGTLMDQPMDGGVFGAMDAAALPTP